VALVLLVEDVQDMLKMMAETLTMDNHRVLEATNGQEAFTRLREAIETPHLIICDIKMPVMDGWAFLAQLRAAPQWKDLPCVILSGDPNDRQIAFDNGANAFLLKPFRYADLAKILQELLN
jgi:CheY-like chemotaxis protein